MQRVYSGPALFLSYLIAGLALVASAGGIFIDGLYRGNDFVVSAWLGNDIVTLVVAVPIFLVAVV